MKPKITVIMLVYNGEKYLKKAIDSVLNQTYKDFELLIINDGSTDNSVNIINSYSDPRIKLLHNGRNQGIVASRNRGLRDANSEFIAILDCDDIAYPRRLEKQLEFLETHPDFGMVGGWAELIDHTGQLTGVAWKNFLSPPEISSFLLFSNYFTHSATMIKVKAIPEGGYGPFEISCDYYLWIKMSNKWKFWNLPEILVKYRVCNTSISKSQKERLNKEIDQIMVLQLANLKINPAPEELKIHRTNYTYDGNDIKEFINKRESWLEKIKKANLAHRYYAEPAFSRVISKLWLAGCSANARLGFWIWKKFWKSPLSKEIKIRTRLLRSRNLVSSLCSEISDWKTIAKFFVKCLLRKSSFN